MSARQCVFCGGSPVTREDAIPLWVIELLFPEGMPGHNQFLASVAPTDETIGARETRAGIRRRIVNRVCERCNGGWMEADQPLIRELVEGRAVRLGAEEQRKIARWAAKTTMMVEFTDSSAQLTTEAHHHWVYEHREPPPGTGVWIMHNTTERWYSRPLIQTIEYGVPYGTPVNYVIAKHYITVGALGFGSLFLLLVMTDVPKMQVGKFVRSDLHRIWPVGPNLDFPCGPVVTPDEVFEIAHVGIRIVRNIPGDALPPPPPGTYAT